MKLRHVLACIFAIALPAIAAAQQATAIGAVALRAGPDAAYPFVASYGAGTPLAVQGCTEGYGWCDVIGPNGDRGWVYAANLGYPYQRRVVPVLSYGPAIGIAVVPFVLATYWGAHYYNRPWYRDRVRWTHYRPVHRPIARPLPPPPHARVVVRPVHPPGPPPPALERGQ